MYELQHWHVVSGELSNNGQESAKHSNEWEDVLQQWKNVSEDSLVPTCTVTSQTKLVQALVWSWHILSGLAQNSEVFQHALLSATTSV